MFTAQTYMTEFAISADDIRWRGLEFRAGGKKNFEIKVHNVHKFTPNLKCRCLESHLIVVLWMALFMALGRYNTG
jgi:hypothetical protein